MSYLRLWELMFAFLAMFGSEADAPITIATGTVRQRPAQPQVAVSNLGHIHVVYGQGNNLRHVASVDGGKSFSAASEIATEMSMSLGMRRGPRVALCDSAIVVSAIGGKKGNGRDGDLLAWSSRDSGKTWSKPVRINDVPDSAREGLHSMANGPKGECYCVWLDLRNKNTEVFGSMSTDGGITWSKNQLIYHSPDGSVCECCQPSVTIGSDGTVHVMWRNALSGNRDMYRTMSKDKGKTFEPAVKLGEASWTIRKCPMDGGAIAVDSLGHVSTVWRRDLRLFVVDSESPKERMLGEGEQAWVSSTTQGPVIVWQEWKGGRIMIQPPGGVKANLLTEGATSPVVASSISGKGPVVVAWEKREKFASKIQLRVFNTWQ